MRTVIAPFLHPRQNRDGEVPLLKASRKSFPFVELAFAGGG
jgi:hypothetical protein